jgi:hypothetical protein
MAIELSCPCGKRSRVPDAAAGKKARCPACKAVLDVPTLPPPEVDDVPFTEPEIVDDLPLTEPEMVDDDEPIVLTPIEWETTGAAPAASAAPAPPVKDDPLDFALVAFLSGVVAKPKFYRVHRDGDRLLFLNAGPFTWRAVDALPDHGKIIGMAARTAGAHGAAAGLALGAAAAGLKYLFDKQDTRAFQERSAALDRLTLDQLRAEIEQDKHSFVVTADNTRDVSIYPPKTGLFADKTVESRIVGNLRFAHQPTGKWDFILLTKPDAKFILRNFRTVLGPANVDATLKFKKKA